MAFGSVFDRVHAAEDALPVWQRDHYTHRPLLHRQSVTRLAGWIAVVQGGAYTLRVGREDDAARSIQQVDDAHDLALADAVEHMLKPLRVLGEHLVLEAAFDDLPDLRGEE